MNTHDNEQTELLRAIWNEMKALGANLGARISDTNARLDQTNARLDQTNVRLEAVVTTMDRRFGETNARLDETNSRLGAVEGALLDLAAQQLMLGRFMRKLVDTDIGELRERLARVEAKLAG